MPLYIAPCFLYPGSLTGCTGRVKYAGLHLQLKCVFLQDGKMPENGEKPCSFVDGAELAKILDNAQEAVEVTLVERLRFFFFSPKPRNEIPDTATTVLLGECTHGTQEFYHLRAEQLSKHLACLRIRVPKIHSFPVSS